jgi:hypothetical protein
VVLQFRVDDVDQQYLRLQDFVKTWVKPPTTQPWGTRSIYFRDPDGNLVDFYAPIKVRGTLKRRSEVRLDANFDQCAVNDGKRKAAVLPSRAHRFSQHAPGHVLWRLNAHDLSNAVRVGTGGHRLRCLHDFSFLLSSWFSFLRLLLVRPLL